MNMLPGEEAQLFASDSLKWGGLHFRLEAGWLGWREESRDTPGLGAGGGCIFLTCLPAGTFMRHCRIRQGRAQSSSLKGQAGSLVRLGTAPASLGINHPNHLVIRPVTRG